MVFSTVTWDTYIVAVEIHCSLSSVGSSELLPQVSWATDRPSPSQLMSPAEFLNEWMIGQPHGTLAVALELVSLIRYKHELKLFLRWEVSLYQAVEQRFGSFFFLKHFF